MSWDAYHRRKSLLREILAAADTTPNNDPSALPPVDDDLLLDVQMHWFQRLSGALENQYGTGDLDPAAGVVRAWRHTAADERGARRILDAHEDDPVLARAQAKELALLAHAAGRAPLHHPDAPRVGARLRSEARAIRIEDAPSAGRRPRWRDRLNLVLGA